MNINTAASIRGEVDSSPESIRKIYDSQFLRRLKKTFQWSKFAQTKSYGKKGAKTIVLTKYNSLPPPTKPLTEGVTPEGGTLTQSKVQTMVEQYGDYLVFTDVVSMTEIDNTIVDAIDIQAEQAGEVVDNLCRDELCSGTNVVYAGGKTTRAAITAADKLTSSNIKKAVKILKKANVGKVGGYYICKIDADAAADIADDPLWRDVSVYNGGKNIIEGELGKMCGVRFIETNNAKIQAGASGLEVHSTIVHGRDAFGIFDLSGKYGRPQTFRQGLGEGEDILHQRSKCGWKIDFAAKRLNELAMVRIEHAVSE